MEIRIPSSINANIHEMEFFKAFMQGIADRRMVGGLRYGSISRRQRYMSRMEKELQVYKKEGNMEQLLNIAVYCFLEAYAPENRKFHWNAAIDSVTRGEFGV